MSLSPLVPAKAGIQVSFVSTGSAFQGCSEYKDRTEKAWVPAFAGMSGMNLNELIFGAI
jgi:hypothetical protein